LSSFSSWLPKGRRRCCCLAWTVMINDKSDVFECCVFGILSKTGALPRRVLHKMYWALTFSNLLHLYDLLPFIMAPASTSDPERQLMIKTKACQRCVPEKKRLKHGMMHEMRALLAHGLFVCTMDSRDIIMPRVWSRLQQIEHTNYSPSF
jgi:hypothetical protein